MTADAARSAGPAPDYQRDWGPPLWTDDLFGDRRVIGFALDVDPGPVDLLLVEGDDDLLVPPYRPLPAPGDPGTAIGRTGQSPAGGLAADLTPAPPELAERVDQLLFAMGEDGDFIRQTLHHAAAERHLMWLVGGAVRDLLAEGDQARPADLDFTGTMGPGELYDAARRWRRRQGAADFRMFVSRRLVWAVAPAGQGRSDAFVEYKPLSQSGFRFAAWGGSLRADAETRDLTINAIYYDHGRRLIADPLGRALTDLRGNRRIAATPCRSADPVVRACVLLRCVKFLLRWPDLDVGPVREWASALPADLADLVPPGEWTSLAGLRDRCVPVRQRGDDGERTAAKQLGPAAEGLVEYILTMEKATP